MDEVLIVDGDALTHKEAVDDFLRAGRHLLEIQRQAEPFGCQLLKHVKRDPELEAILAKYTYEEQ